LKTNFQSKEEDVQRVREIARRTHPTSKEDFAILHAELQAWMEQETERINSLGLSEEERLAALAVLLSHETRIIQTIDRLKIEAKAENQESRINHMLEQVSPFIRRSLPRFASFLLHIPSLFRCLLQNK
jgi:hypothetical protein